MRMKWKLRFAVTLTKKLVLPRLLSKSFAYVGGLETVSMMISKKLQLIHGQNDRTRIAMHLTWPRRPSLFWFGAFGLDLAAKNAKEEVDGMMKQGVRMTLNIFKDFDRPMRILQVVCSMSAFDGVASGKTFHSTSILHP